MGFKITADTTVGEVVELSPEFNNDIKVKFATDISANVRRKAREISGNTKLSEQQKGVKLIELMLSASIFGWNLTDGEDVDLPITVDTIDNLLPKSIADWIIKEAQSFLGLTSKQEAK